MVVKGRFVGDAAYISAHLSSSKFEGKIWFLLDTGASRTTLLDRDVKLLNIPLEALEPSQLPIVGIGGSVRSFIVRNTEISFLSDQGISSFVQDLWVVQHDIDLLPPEEVSRILRLPSILGRDLNNRFRLTYNYQSGIVQFNH